LPGFADDLTFLNVTLDLLDMSDAEHVLIESTARLDQYHSRLVRNRNRFHFELANAASDINPFSIKYDQAGERLLLKMNPNYLELLKSNKSLSTFVYKLTVRRPRSESSAAHYETGTSSTASVQINLKDNRYDRPIFDYAVYNFTVVENTPLNSIIGRVNAIYLNAMDTSLIKYRIVPFLDDKSFSFVQDMAGSEEASISQLPIKIEQATGLLVQKTLIDREKFVNDQQQKEATAGHMGLISFNVEASYASTLYDYCKVNVFIKDVNDNAPVARIKPLNNFDRAQTNVSCETGKII
jgi:hypothetical protein